MTIDEAQHLLKFVQAHAPDDLPVPDWARTHSDLPRVLAAMADLGGALEDATDLGELWEAVEHAQLLIRIGILDFDHIADAVLTPEAQ